MKTRVLMAVVVLFTMVGCGGKPAQPQVLTSLLAIAPPDSTVTVDHWTPGPFGSGDERWEWVVKSSDNRAVLAAYDEWFRENGISTTTTESGGLSADGRRLTIELGTDPVGAAAVLGTLYDDSALAR